jgi:hypothetical protein
MGDEELRRAPMMHQKWPRLDRIITTLKPDRCTTESGAIWDVMINPKITLGLTRGE